MDPALNPAVCRVESRLSRVESIIAHEDLEAKEIVTIRAAVVENSNVTKGVCNSVHEEHDASGADSEETFPEGGLQAWLVVLGAFLTILPSWGFQVSVGTLQDYWHQNQLKDYSARDVGWIPSVFIYLPLAGGLLVGPLFDRFGPRYMLLVGTLLYVSMMFLLAECTEYWQILLCCGFLGGLGGALLCTTGLSSVSHWFNVRRGLVSGIAMSGSSLGGLLIPLILQQLLPRYGYQWSIRILGFLFLGCLTFGNLLVKARIPPRPAAQRPAIISLSVFTDLRFVFLVISVFALEVVLVGALGLLPTYATIATDFPPATGFNLIAVLNGASTLGRLLPGYVSDKIGRFNMLLLMMNFTLVFMLGLWLPLGTSSLSALYAFATIFGFGSGSWMASVPACIGQLCRGDDFGRYFGSLYCIAGLSTLISIPVSGELIQALGPQAMVGFNCAVLAVGILAHSLSRLACLGWKWDWSSKI